MRITLSWLRRVAFVLAIGIAAAPGAPAADEPAKPPEAAARALDSVVRVRTQVPREARTAPYLGTTREGSGVVIDSQGLIVTIGYLVTEAMAAEVIPVEGPPVIATVLGFDSESGLGLLRATEKLAVKPIPLGRAADLAERQPVLVASFGGVAAAQPALVVSRRSFAGYWEYLLDDAIFTAPPHPNWGGAALIGADGRLLGIGSLMVPDALPGHAMPGNMFVPVDRLKPVMADLMTLGRPGTPARPWLGVNVQELQGRLVVTRVSEEGPADKAGIERGDLIVAVNGARIGGLRDFYQKLWASGGAGVDVPITLQDGSEVRTVTVKTVDRYSYLKLNTSY